jgi:hypothetical protein
MGLPPARLELARHCCQRILSSMRGSNGILALKFDFLTILCPLNSKKGPQNILQKVGISLNTDISGNIWNFTKGHMGVLVGPPIATNEPPNTTNRPLLTTIDHQIAIINL